MSASELNVGIICSLVLDTCVSGRCQGWLWYSQEHRGRAQTAPVGLMSEQQMKRYLLVDKTKGPAGAVAFSSELLCLSSLGGLELCGAPWRWNQLSRLEVGSAEACAEEECSVFYSDCCSALPKPSLFHCVQVSSMWALRPRAQFVRQVKGKHL